jgi:carboxyl-terminal processing protease
MTRASVDNGARCAVLMLAVAVAGCGGGGDDGGTGGGGALPPPASGWVAGSFLPASSFAGKCVNPRSGTDPRTGQAYNEIRGTATDENNFLRSWSNDLYLWYNEIVDRDPGLHTTPAYFDLLVTTAKTASGRDKDQFHFTYATSDWLNLSQSGIEAGYGANWAVLSTSPPLVVAYTEPGSPARSAGVAFERGAQVLRVDNIDAVNPTSQAQIDAIFDALYPDSVGEQHTFTVRDPRTSFERTIPLTSVAVTKSPVPISSVIPTSAGPVGYLLFHDHILTAEQPLVTAIEQMRTASVSDLVLDVRYNGGGYLFLASQLAYMIAGPARTSGQTFERLQFNDKHTSIDPVTRQPLTPMPFLSTTSSGQPLPTLNLPRVYVLTGGTTCSASESIVNGLRGVGVEVIQIGSTTCGKPYGFYPQDNCGTTYFSIQFRGVNAAGFGDYSDGFSPSNTPRVTTTPVPGCSVADDFSSPLGDLNEDLLQTALNRRLGLTCPAPSGSKPSFTKPFNGAAGEDASAVVLKSPWFTNRWLGGR